MASIDNPPGSWVQNPDNLIAKDYPTAGNVAVAVWKNETTGEVLVHYETFRNSYLYKFDKTKKAEGLVNTLIDKLSSGELEQVGPKGKTIEKGKLSEVQEAALEYMETNL